MAYSLLRILESNTVYHSEMAVTAENLFQHSETLINYLAIQANISSDTLNLLKYEAESYFEQYLSKRDQISAFRNLFNQLSEFLTYPPIQLIQLDDDFPANKNRIIGAVQVFDSNIFGVYSIHYIEFTNEEKWHIQDHENDLIATVPIDDDCLFDSFNQLISNYCRWGNFLLFSSLPNFTTTFLQINPESVNFEEILLKVKIYNESLLTHISNNEIGKLIPLIYTKRENFEENFILIRNLYKNSALILEEHRLECFEFHIGNLLILEKLLLLQGVPKVRYRLGFDITN